MPKIIPFRIILPHRKKEILQSLCELTSNDLDYKPAHKPQPPTIDHEFLPPTVNSPVRDQRSAIRPGSYLYEEVP